MWPAGGYARSDGRYARSPGIENADGTVGLQHGWGFLGFSGTATRYSSGDPALDPDADGDGAQEACDNCPGDDKPGQADSDWDGRGDSCEPCAGQGVVIDNGTVQLGVDGEAHLITPNTGGQRPRLIGLTYLPTATDAVTPGRANEGWGVADSMSGVAGSTNRGADGVVNLRTVQEVAVETENIGDSPGAPRSRRVMDWDIAPTTFDEMVTIVNGRSAVRVAPNNHRRAAFDPTARAAATDACGAPLDLGADAKVLSIDGDESEDARGNGDGNPLQDIASTGATSFELGAERAGGSNGRVCGVRFTGPDSAGNESGALCRFEVRHDDARSAVDDGHVAGDSVAP
jgi:hypothetical protein